MPTASINSISIFCRTVAHSVTIPEIITLCKGAKINTSTHFVSCPNPKHRLHENHISHCSYGGRMDQCVFHCFSCGLSGDSVTYLAQWLGISNFAAARLINQIFELKIQDPCL